MIICNSRKYIFIHIHKTGGTSIELALAPTLEWNDIILGSSPLGKAMNLEYSRCYGLRKHSRIMDVIKVCGHHIVNTYYTFAIVRHPLNRLVSLYNFVRTQLEQYSLSKALPISKLRELAPKAVAGDFLAWPATKALLAATDFHDFAHEPILFEDPGYRPQKQSLVDENSSLRVENVIRLEDLNSQISRVQRRIGVPFSVLHTNKSLKTFIQASEIDKQTRAHIECVYKDDYDAFGY